jgi:hypothetical protein
VFLWTSTTTSDAVMHLQGKDSRRKPFPKDGLPFPGARDLQGNIQISLLHGGIPAKVEPPSPLRVPVQLGQISLPFKVRGLKIAQCNHGDLACCFIACLRVWTVHDWVVWDFCQTSAGWNPLVFHDLCSTPMHLCRIAARNETVGLMTVVMSHRGGF